MKQFFILLVMIFSAIHSVQAQIPPPPPPVDSINYEKIIFNKVETEAGFPGGQEGWKQYLIKNLQINKVADQITFPRGKKQFKQTIIVKFIVDRKGIISEVAAENLDADPYCIAEAIRVIKVSPPWIPAQQNGRAVNAYRRQPITFLFER